MLPATNIEGLNVNITYHRFADLAPLGATAAFHPIFNEHFVNRLNVVHVPSRFRRSALALI